MRRLAKIVGFGLFIAAITQEMSKPEDERTWNGKVFGLVPYDFRPPTWKRLEEAYWNPEDPRLFTDRPFGIGWAINFFRARQLLQDSFEALMGPVAPPAYKRWQARTSSGSSGSSGSSRSTKKASSE